MIQGYYAALERTLFLGHVADASLKYWQANVDVHMRGLELIKPGVRCCDVAHELNEMVLSQGMLDLRSFGYGHSFGLVSYYYGREAGLELREDVETVIEPGGFYGADGDSASGPARCWGLPRARHPGGQRGWHR